MAVRTVTYSRLGTGSRRATITSLTGTLSRCLRKLGIPHQPGQRFHAFRRFRTTVLRADAVPGKDGVPEHLISYWTGHKDQSINGCYDYSSKEFVAWRKNWAEKAGTGFEVPIKLGLVGPKRPMLDPNPAEVQRVASSVEEAA